MSESDLLSRYVEALSALSSIESRQRDSLRKAVESANAAETQAKTQMADQQRMYDRTRRDAHDTERLLTELFRMVGATPSPQIRPTLPAGPPPPLVQIRGQIREVTQWATDTKPTIESLLRTRDRLAKAPKPVSPTPAPESAPTPGVQAAPKKLALGVIAAIAALVIIVIVVIAL